MGAEAAGTVRFDGKTSSGKILLETDVLLFRGADVRLSIPLARISKTTVRGGTLTVTFPEGTAAFGLGAQATKWADRIQHPPSRLDKIGLKPEAKVSVVGVDDATFVAELRRGVPDVTVGRFVKNSDAVFFGAAKAADLRRFARLKTLIKATGAVWVIRPRGRPDVSERAVMAAGRAAGLVDVKVVRFSPTHTAEKFVIPAAERR
jgi:hypothetical protein